jgi:hypothetical protein
MTFSEKAVRSWDVPSEEAEPSGRANDPSGAATEPLRDELRERNGISWPAKIFRFIARLDFVRAQSSLPRHAYSEFAGHHGLEATRYGDWEYSGRCTDF